MIQGLLFSNNKDIVLTIESKQNKYNYRYFITFKSKQHEKDF